MAIDECLDVAAWVATIFDHPAEGPKWYHDPFLDVPEPDPVTRVRLLTELLRQPATQLTAYSEAQLAQGILYLVDSSCSSYASTLLDPAVELQARLGCIEAIPNLYTEIFEPLCAPRLSHCDAEGESPLNTTCYMLWDVFPSWGTPRRDVDEALLSAMASPLELEALPCRESGLHGLGHWRAAYPERVSGIIDRFLERDGLADALRRYAHAARDGCVQ